MKKLLSILLLSTSMACNHQNQDDAEKLKKEVFALHDKIMPISMNLEDSKENILKKALEKKDSVNAKIIVAKIDSSYAIMEVWMQKIGEVSDMPDNEEKITKLQELKKEGLALEVLTNEAKALATKY